MIKAIRNAVADSSAVAVDTLPFLERGFFRLGYVCGGLPYIKTVYYRAIETLGARWRRENRQYRTVTIGHQRFMFDVTDFTVSSWYFHHQMFEPETTRFILENVKVNETVIDIGANRGYVTILAALQVGASGKVYSFEPNPAVHRGLLKHLELNRLSDRVSVSTLAVSDTDGQEVTFYVSNLAANSGLSSLTPQADLLTTNALSKENTIRVKTTTLDSWLKQQGIEQRVDFIKVDVEGAETLLLSGAKETLRHRPPKRWIIETKIDSGVTELMEGYGYETRRLEQSLDTINVLCTHTSS